MTTADAALRLQLTWQGGGTTYLHLLMLAKTLGRTGALGSRSKHLVPDYVQAAKSAGKHRGPMLDISMRPACLLLADRQRGAIIAR